MDVRLIPVQCGGGLAQTHVCSLVTLLCFLVVRDQHCHWASFITIIIPISNISFLFSFQSTHGGSLLCFNLAARMLVQIRQCDLHVPIHVRGSSKASVG